MKTKYKHTELVPNGLAYSIYYKNKYIHAVTYQKGSKWILLANNHLQTAHDTLHKAVYTALKYNGVNIK